MCAHDLTYTATPSALRPAALGLWVYMCISQIPCTHGISIMCTYVLHMYVCMYVYIYIYIYICMYVSTYVCKYIRM